MSEIVKAHVLELRPIKDVCHRPSNVAFIEGSSNGGREDEVPILPSFSGERFILQFLSELVVS